MRKLAIALICVVALVHVSCSDSMGPGECKSLSHLVITITWHSYHSPRSTPSDTPLRDRTGRELMTLTSNRRVVPLPAL